MFQRSRVRRNGPVSLLTLTFILFLVENGKIGVTSEEDVSIIGNALGYTHRQGITSDSQIIDNDVRRILAGRSAEVILPSQKNSTITTTTTEKELTERKESLTEDSEAEKRSDLKEFDGKNQTFTLASPSTVSNDVRKEKTGADKSKEEESSTVLVLRLAHCRASCLDKRNSRLRENGKLVSVKKLLPSGGNDHVIRTWFNQLLGCKEACKFHQNFGEERVLGQNGSSSSSPSVLAGAKVESILSYYISPANVSRVKSKPNKTFFQLDLAWPPVVDVQGAREKEEDDGDKPVVYSVIQHVPTKTVNSIWTWKLLEQTIKTNISLTFSVKPKKSDIRVLATTPTRLVRVFSVKTTKVDAQNGISNSDHGGVKEEESITAPLLHEQQHASNQVGGGRRQTENGGGGVGRGENSWHLRKVSMTHQKFLVITEIRWDSPAHGVAPSTTSHHQDHIVRTRANISTPINSQFNPKAEESLPVTLGGSSSGVGSSESSKEHYPEKFLLTWQEDGGFLKGNMVTDTNAVTVSLLPNTAYLIQVGLIQEEEEDESSDRQGTENPWDSELLEPKVSVWSSFLKLNTSEATTTYLLPHGTTDDFEESFLEASTGKSNSESHQNAQEQPEKTVTVIEGIQNDSIFQDDFRRRQHHKAQPLISSKEKEEDKIERGNSHHRSLWSVRPILNPFHGIDGDHDHHNHHHHHHVGTRDKTLFSLTCDCSREDRASKWCCQALIVSLSVIFVVTIAGLVVLTGCFLAIYYCKLLYPSSHSYLLSRQSAKDFFFSSRKRSNSSLDLLEQEENEIQQQQQQSSPNHVLPHDTTAEDDGDRLGQAWANLQYNIV